MATLIKTDGTLKVVHPQAGIGKTFTLEELQCYVCGSIEIIRMNGGTLCVVNEDGRIIRLKPNERASLATGYDLVGDVLLCDNSEIN